MNELITKVYYEVYELKTTKCIVLKMKSESKKNKRKKTSKIYIHKKKCINMFTNNYRHNRCRQ